MKITGLETLIFAVHDVDAVAQFVTDYGLIENTAIPADAAAEGCRRFEALDGSGLELYPADTKAMLPPSPAERCLLRKTVMGVYDQDTLDAIAKELLKDREVRHLEDGSIESFDDSGFALGFQVSRRQLLPLPGEICNVPGSPVQRNANDLGVKEARGQIHPRTLSHIVYFVPDVKKAEAFYVERLGFRCTDRFENVGPFMQPGGSPEHHTHFLIQTPPHMQNVEHFTFHFAGPGEVIENGTQFVNKGYQSFWGPGRHIMGSNWFWYFNSPFACHIEMDADMDLHDLNWEPRVRASTADNSQTFLLKGTPKWFPGA